ncbi:TPA: hypothetical protein QHN42_003838 [Enterobacter hormaechei subsp. steigerwaltii]|jgi:hypothetical protein|uniref:hypothetical protein n=1 Tax=Enterobacterales TaxID=91347 RepID=UPI00067E5E46|nr:MULTISPECIES: hypothetical protein [Enterobacterales]HCS2230371.1 hypothetical protein [Shigella sonnei]HDR2627796.1 hypothetical protein [Enterobacter cancerogenus]HDT4165710.1 hypothetical protein [Enterobacter hormaechei subsp. steigerwaltii]EEZ6817795.1 hypothetical protein [Escherichia coli]ELG6444329.1 hypothetical protein [Enterobacter cloacae]
MDDMVFYPKGQLFFEEAIHDGKQFVTRYGKQPLDVLNMQGEQYVLVSRNEAIEMIREAARKPVEEITAEIFNDQLEVVPPIDWYGKGDDQSFKLGEMHAEDVTDIYAYYRGRYFRFRDRVSMKHSEIIQRIEQEVFAKQK